MSLHIKVKSDFIKHIEWVNMLIPNCAASSRQTWATAERLHTRVVSVPQSQLSEIILFKDTA